VPFSAASLRSLLEHAVGNALQFRYCVGFSGGADSTALLAAMAELRDANAGPGLRALHVDHALQRESGDWARRALDIAADFKVACTVERLAIDRAGGESLEAAARAARYALFARSLGAGEILLTAHHVDDQLETVLLQLVRGAGVAGLAAMPMCTPLGAGSHLRPLLGVTHAALVEYLSARRVPWFEDPMNADTRFDRSFMRARILPALRERWPAVAANVGRSARHMADAQTLLEGLAERDWVRARDGDRLELASLAALARERALNLLRFWIRRAGRPLPSADNLEQLLETMTHAAGDSQPRVSWPGADVRRYRGRLYLAASYYLPELRGGLWHWCDGASFQLGPGLGSLKMATARGAASLARDRLPAALQVRRGSGGVSIRPAAGARRRALRNLFQEHGIVPWVRAHVPLVYAGRDLVAVGDLWTEASYQAQPGEGAVRIDWHGGPDLY
jgi:tRNA(Ile)-lysidine synthase